MWFYGQIRTIHLNKKNIVPKEYSNTNQKSKTTDQFIMSECKKKRLSMIDVYINGMHL